MKLRFPVKLCFSRSRNRMAMRHEKAFALISIITLLCLVAVICLGLLSLSSLSLRGSTASAAQASAQANARLALMFALGDLQKFAGPDQRITAHAEINVPAPQSGNLPGALPGPNMKWVGVWSTTRASNGGTPSITNAPTPSKPAVMGAADPNYPDTKFLSDARAIPGYTSQSWRMAWLVSGNPNPANLPPTPASDYVTLVQRSAGLANATDADLTCDRISVPSVKISQASKQRGAYAYWVGDESLKARVNLKPTDKQPDVNDPTDGGMARLAGAEGANVRFVKSGATKPYGPIQDLSAADRRKLITTAELAIPLNSTSVPQKNFHDLTVYSESVLADAREGGLKKDLTSYISKPGENPIPALAGIPETGLTQVGSQKGRAMLPGDLYGAYAPNFLQLRNWFQLSKNVTGKIGSGSMEPVFLPTRTSTANYGPMPDIKACAQAVHPYMTSCKVAYDFSIDSTRGTSGKALRLHVYPRVTLWNPYNVTLNPAKYWVGCFKDVGNMALMNVAYCEVIPGTNGNFYGNESRSMIYFQLDAPAMGPGECLVFSPAGSSPETKYEASNPSANVLSASVPSGGLENFYFDSLRQLPASVTTWQNQPYQIETGENRQFVLKSAAGSTTSPETAPILQRLATSSCGETGAYYAGSVHGNWKQNEASVLFKPSSSHSTTVPSRHWYAQARMQWMDECSGEVSGGYGAPVGAFSVRKPIIANFNIRPNIVHRSNFCTALEQWYWNYGPYLDGRAEQKPLNDAAFRGPYSNGKALDSPFGYPVDYPGVESYVMFDVPQPDTPLFSLACFQHAQLSYQGWQPTYIVGNSLCEPRCGSGADPRDPAVPYLSRDITVHQAYYNLGYGPAWAWQQAGGSTTYKNAWDANLENDRNGTGRWNDLIQNTSGGEMKEMLFYDASYMVNYALWDRYFLSSLPHNNSGTPIWDNSTATLPNARMILNPYSGISATQRTSLITGANSFDSMAYLFLNQGGFNINSTSVEAWRAFFSSLNDVSRPTRDGKKVLAAFSRLLIPSSDKGVGNHQSASPWTSARVLTEAEIDALANEMVRVVRSRGPFLGVADFVNRRLMKVKGKVKGPLLAEDKEGNIKTDASLCGPLQAAIEAARINSALQNDTIKSPSLGAQSVTGGDWVTADARRGGWSFDNRSVNPDFWAFAPWKTFGAPGYLTQADVLQAMGSNITARGDTFVVRGYGETRDANGKVTAKAWCEAVVQRTPDYLAGKSVTDPSDASGNNPLEPAVIRSTSDYTLADNPALLPINKKFGRRFVIRNFRWLNPSEV